MGPNTLVDKSTIQSLSPSEVLYFSQYFSLVLSPILLRELVSTLGKESSPNRDWKKTLSILSYKVDTISSYIIPDVNTMATSNLLGIDDIPMTGQVPLSGGKPVRCRDGTYGVFFEESPQRAVFRRWKEGNFSEDDKRDGQSIREIDHTFNLTGLKKTIEKETTNFPKYKTLYDYISWLDESLFNQESHQEFLIKSAASTLKLNPEKINKVIIDWEQKGSPLFSIFRPYAFYVHRCNVIYQVGLGKELIPSSKKAKSHLDMQYIYYLPFCMVFTSGDNFLLDYAKHFIRSDQKIAPAKQLKSDLKNLNDYFESLNEEQKKDVRGKLDDYPPDKQAPYISSIWKKYMSPRNELKDSTPKLSEKQRDEITTKQINKFKESVDVETNRCIGPSPNKKWLQLGIVERNIHFVNKALDLAGISETSDWNEIKRTFNSQNVKEIYNLHADIWQPDDDQWSLATQIRSNGRSKFLYLGEIEPEEIVNSVLRWVLHFDQILIPDPFRSPWAHKEEHNPIAKPIQYEADTFKLISLLCLLHLLILKKKVLFIPDPSNFNPKMKNKLLDIGNKKKNDPLSIKLFEEDKNKLMSYQLQNQMRIYARLPEPQRRSVVKAKLKEKAEDCLEYLSSLRKSDPLCLDRDSDLQEGELRYMRSGACFELSVILSGLYGAVPFSNLKVRESEYRNISIQPNEYTAKIWKQFNQIPGFTFLDPVFSSVMMEKDVLIEFRQLFASLLSVDSVPVELSSEKVSETLNLVREDCQTLAEIYSKDQDLDAEKLIGNFEFEVLYNNNGFINENISDIRNEYFSHKEIVYPKHFISLLV